MNEKTTLREEMRNIKTGDKFYIYGQEHTASADAHLSGDASCDEFIVYDENGESWFESDFPRFDVGAKARILVDEEQLAEACRILEKAGIDCDVL